MQEKLQINSASISDKGLSEKRPENEDSYLELRDSGLFAVADGVGGAQAGDVASQMAMEILGEAFINLQQDGDAEERMKMAIEQANSAIFQMSNDLPQLSTMATTVVALHLNGNVATIGHVGDSRLYRLDPQGDLYQETYDHSVVEEAVRAGRLTPEQAAVHPGRNVISRALGAEEGVEVDMKTIMFEPNTTFLICSDGVTRHIPDEELRDLLFTEKDTFVICQKIKDICYERGAEDNLTAVIVKAGTADETFDGAETIDIDIEEETIATARPVQTVETPPTETDDNTFVGTLDNIEDVSTEASTEDFETSPLEETVETQNQEVINIPAQSENEISKLDDAEKPTSIKAEEDIKSYRVDEQKSEGGFFSTLFSILPWFLLLGVLGAGAYYYWYHLKPNTTGITPTDGVKTLSNNDLIVFEGNRRSVDEDPSKFVADRSNDAEDAVDYYLLGRAYLLQKKYQEAKNNFIKAKERLNIVDATNKKVLENEIAIGLALANSEEAQKIFQDDNRKETASDLEDTNTENSSDENNNTTQNTNAQQKDSEN